MRRSSLPRRLSGTTFAIALLVVAIGVDTAPAGAPGLASSWGLNRSGQLGRSVSGGAVFSPTPATISKLSGLIQVAAGGAHSLALRSDGTVWAWGNNGSGQLGNGTAGGQRDSAVQVLTGASKPLTGVVQISAGSGYSVALRGDGRVYAWGDNTYGQLGDGTKSDRPFATLVSSLSSITQIDAGGTHTLAVQQVGSTTRALSWGSNAVGQLGRGTPPDDLPSPGPVVARSPFQRIDAGRSHSLGVGEDGLLYAWGGNNAGQLGDGSTNDRSRPVLVQFRTPGVDGEAYYNFSVRAQAISAGGNHSLAVGSAGPYSNYLFAWGENGNGQLGNGTTEDASYAIPVIALSFTPTHIAAGGSHSLAMIQGSQLYAWGDGGFGAVGDGGTTDRTKPVKASGLAKVEEIAAGLSHNLAIVTPPPAPGGGRVQRPTLRLEPPIGPPGFVTYAVGSFFPKNATVTLSWNIGLGTTIVKAGPSGGFASGTFRVPILIFPRDFLGPRTLIANPFNLEAEFLVVPATLQPRRFVSRS